MLRIAVIGTGNMGRKYSRMIQEHKIKDLVLTAVVCRSESAQEWGRSLHDVEVFRSAEELFAHPDLYDAVLIATPHKLHPSLALQAFSLNKHVLCEKPAAVEVRDARTMAETAAERKLKYGLVFHLRTRPEYVALKEMIQQGEFGTIHRVQMTNTRYFRTEAYHHSSPWRSTLEGEGGGALINQGQHCLDLWAMLFGVPEELQAMVMRGKYNDFDVEDEATILMKYKDGMTGSFLISTAEGMYEEKLVISGSRKAAILEGTTLKVITFSSDTDKYRSSATTHAREGLQETVQEIQFEETSGDVLYERILQNFTNAVLKEEPLIASGKDGISSLLLTQGAYRSEDSKKRIRIEDVE